MKRISEFIIEKLKVSSHNSEYLFSIEEIVSMLKKYCDRYRFGEDKISASQVFGEYPKVLEYNGDFTTDNIVGKDIKVIGYYKSSMSNKEFIYIDFDYNENGIEIHTTKDLYDIFGEDNVDKLYRFLSK